MKLISSTQVKRINDIIFNFLWSGKDFKIKKDICFLPRDLGGLNMLNLEIVIKVKRINWIIRFLKEDKGQPWSKLIESYMRCLDNHFDIEFFCLKVTDATDLVQSARIPAFYKECIIAFQELLRISKVSHDNEILWCNHQVSFFNKPIHFKSWAKSGFKTISDVYSRKRLDPFEIRRKLHNNLAAFIFQMAKLKKALPGQIDSELPDNEIVLGGKEHILQTQIKVPDNGIKTFGELTSKELYRIFLMNNVPTIPSKHYWEQKLNVNEIHWDTWFKINSTNKFLPRPEKDFNWRLMNNLVNFNSKLRYMKHPNGTPYHPDGTCDVCKNGDISNAEHLLFACQNSSMIWKKIENLLSYVEGKRVTIGMHQALTGFWQDGVGDEILLKNSIMSITKYHFWKVRNSIKYDDKSIDLLGSSRILKSLLINHIEVLSSIYSQNDTVKAYLLKLKEALEEHNYL